MAGLRAQEYQPYKRAEMRVLIGCEASGKVRDEFEKRGADAWSCDLRPATGKHLQCDVFRALSDRWDLVILHPPCTYLCSSGLWRNRYTAGRAEKTQQALAFVRELMRRAGPKWVIENPVGCIGTKIRPADQFIQPYQFGDDASKKTGLWLCGVSPLSVNPSLRVPGRLVEWKGKLVERWSNQTDSGQNRESPSAERWIKRSETYPGIARAMAETWCH